MSVDADELRWIQDFAAKMAEAHTRSEELADRFAEIRRQSDLRPDQVKTVAREQRRAPAEPAAAPPLPPGSARPFSKTTRWANADWYELLLAPLGHIKVPEVCLITGGDRAWRREEVR